MMFSYECETKQGIVVRFTVTEGPYFVDHESYDGETKIGYKGTVSYDGRPEEKFSMVRGFQDACNDNFLKFLIRSVVDPGDPMTFTYASKH